MLRSPMRLAAHDSATQLSRKRPVDVDVCALQVVQGVSTAREQRHPIADTGAEWDRRGIPFEPLLEEVDGQRSVGVVDELFVMEAGEANWDLECLASTDIEEQDLRVVRRATVRIEGELAAKPVKPEAAHAACEVRERVIYERVGVGGTGVGVKPVRPVRERCSAAAPMAARSPDADVPKSAGPERSDLGSTAASFVSMAARYLAGSRLSAAREQRRFEAAGARRHDRIRWSCGAWPILCPCAIPAAGS